jgi:hypothetical protein
MESRKFKAILRANSGSDFLKRFKFIIVGCYAFISRVKSLGNSG